MRLLRTSTRLIMVYDTQLRLIFAVSCNDDNLKLTPRATVCDMGCGRHENLNWSVGPLFYYKDFSIGKEQRNNHQEPYKCSDPLLLALEIDAEAFRVRELNPWAWAALMLCQAKYLDGFTGLKAVLKPGDTGNCSTKIQRCPSLPLVKRCAARSPSVCLLSRCTR